MKNKRYKIEAIALWTINVLLVVALIYGENTQKIVAALIYGENTQQICTASTEK